MRTVIRQIRTVASHPMRARSTRLLSPFWGRKDAGGRAFSGPSGAHRPDLPARISANCEDPGPPISVAPDFVARIARFIRNCPVLRGKRRGTSHPMAVLASKVPTSQ